MADIAGSGGNDLNAYYDVQSSNQGQWATNNQIEGINKQVQASASTPPEPNWQFTGSANSPQTGSPPDINDTADAVNSSPTINSDILPPQPGEGPIAGSSVPAAPVASVEQVVAAASTAPAGTVVPIQGPPTSAPTLNPQVFGDNPDPAIAAAQMAHMPTPGIPMPQTPETIAQQKATDVLIAETGKEVAQIDGAFTQSPIPGHRDLSPPIAPPSAPAQGSNADTSQLPTGGLAIPVTTPQAPDTTIVAAPPTTDINPVSGGLTGLVP